jgi:N6-L-threonylcarbamoyladenine synthase
MPLILGIESTCDETAAAVVRGEDVQSNVVSSQIALHQKYRGVVPEIASRAHVEQILPVIRQAVAEAGITMGQIDAIAVANRPGLIGSLLIGVTAAKTLAWSLGKPLIAVDHVQAHLFSVLLRTPGLRYTDGPDSSPQSPALRSTSEPAPVVVDVAFPAVGLVCSGGHTAIYDVQSWTDVRRIGATIDDAVGEAYDKVAAILGLEYPGGPVIDRLAATGDPAAVKLPRSMLEADSLDFSFSGLKTAVLYHVRGVPSRREPRPEKTPPTPDQIADIAASFQSAAVGVLIAKLRRAIAQTGARSVIIGGGVSANRGLRAAVKALPVPVYVPAGPYCTDNAAMIAGLAGVHFHAGNFAGLELDAMTYSAIQRGRAG